MLQAMVRRGPDDEGLLLEPGVALGMRRLSIIDLGGGHQPVFNEDGTVGIVFNGEIYNFPELRDHLEARGHTFRTRSDTETIVHAYEEWGEGCVERLRGMFAFAIFDRREDQRGAGGGDGRGDGRRSVARVLLARDRLGIKPLYVFRNESAGTLLFASEVRALLASGAVARRLSPEAVESYLFFGSVVEPMTLVEGVYSLPPGHILSVDCAVPLAAAPKPYWDLAAAAQASAAAASPSSRPMTIAEAGRAARPLLEQAVRSHLLADVPLGLFLSSGIDSTAIAALAARERSGLHTFTVVFPEHEFSEAPMARRTAERLGTQHQELLLTGAEMAARLGEAVGALDQPSMDGINTFFVSWAARRVGLKVALSGLGGDEVFGGYSTFRTTPRLAILASLGRFLPGPAYGPIAGLLAGGGAGNRDDAAGKIAALWSQPHALPHPYFFARMLFTPAQVDRLLPAARRRASGHDERGQGSVARLVGPDRGAGRAARRRFRGFGARAANLYAGYAPPGHRFDEHASFAGGARAAARSSVGGIRRRRAHERQAAQGVPKALLVAALGDLLPPEVVQQRKRTFTFPWERWLRGELGAQVERRLGDLAPSLAAVLDAREVQGAWRNFSAGRTGWARPWSLFVLNEWVRHHLDEAGTVEAQAHSAAGHGAASSVVNWRCGSAQSYGSRELPREESRHPQREHSRNQRLSRQRFRRAGLRRPADRGRGRGAL